jgi:hypothetical protein
MQIKKITSLGKLPIIEAEFYKLSVLIFLSAGAKVLQGSNFRSSERIETVTSPHNHFTVPYSSPQMLI